MKLTVTKDLDALRGDALLRLDRAMRAKRDAIDPGAAVNADVRSAKLAEARSYSGGVLPPLLHREAILRGIPAADVARLVVEKAAAATATIATIEADRQRLQMLIRAAATPAEIDAALFQAAGDA